MKQSLVKLASLMSYVLISCFNCEADNKAPCLIFSGNAEDEYCIDLAKLNRISFGDNSMVVSSSKDESMQSVELLYSLYHHLVIGDATPSDIETGIEGVEADYNSRLYIDAQAKLLHLQSASDSQFSVGVFDVSGHLLLTSELHTDDAVTLEVLAPGVYIAVATDGNIKLILKFILN